MRIATLTTGDLADFVELIAIFKDVLKMIITEQTKSTYQHC